MFLLFTPVNRDDSQGIFIWEHAGSASNSLDVSSDRPVYQSCIQSLVALTICEILEMTDSAASNNEEFKLQT